MPGAKPFNAPIHGIIAPSLNPQPRETQDASLWDAKPLQLRHIDREDRPPLIDPRTTNGGRPGHVQSQIVGAKEGLWSRVTGSCNGYMTSYEIIELTYEFVLFYTVILWFYMILYGYTI